MRQSKDANANITVYNLLGQKIATLVSGEIEASYHTVRWDGKDNSGNKLASGIYFYRLQAGDYTATKKMYLMR
ncbi:MAG: FlgD immunoglobulin-like domain containing protein [bacterium]|nr:FlgD immunoglobulin-like domain containing protein [bacterium]